MLYEALNGAHVKVSDGLVTVILNDRTIDIPAGDICNVNFVKGNPDGRGGLVIVTVSRPTTIVVPTNEVLGVPLRDAIRVEVEKMLKVTDDAVLALLDHNHDANPSE